MAPAGQAAIHQSGMALVVGTSDHRSSLVDAVKALGLSSAEASDPYAAMAELCRRPHEYQALVLSLAGLYREELQIIPAVQKLADPVEIWLADTDGRSAALAEAMRLGVDGLLGDDGLHRLGKPVDDPSGEPYIPIVSVQPTPVVTRTNPQPAPAAQPVVAAVYQEIQEMNAANSATASHAPESAGDPFAIRHDTGRDNWELRRPAAAAAPSSAGPPSDDDDFTSGAGEPVLTAEELRALLQDHSGLSPL